MNKFCTTLYKIVRKFKMDGFFVSAGLTFFWSYYSIKLYLSVIFFTAEIWPWIKIKNLFLYLYIFYILFFLLGLFYFFKNIIIIFRTIKMGFFAKLIKFHLVKTLIFLCLPVITILLLKSWGFLWRLFLDFLRQT